MSAVKQLKVTMSELMSELMSEAFREFLKEKVISKMRTVDQELESLRQENMWETERQALSRLLSHINRYFSIVDTVPLHEYGDLEFVGSAASLLCDLDNCIKYIKDKRSTFILTKIQ
ncbi:hypothetical protein WMY93_012917 [Mugilogobius chulae]|uniref:Uncharacterized protein n=1 Tax=Mugilogobius chulae TaxID=88201 RepID=A0AAW0PAE9_9GOBI